MELWFTPLNGRLINGFHWGYKPYIRPLLETYLGWIPRDFLDRFEGISVRLQDFDFSTRTETACVFFSKPTVFLESSVWPTRSRIRNLPRNSLQHTLDFCLFDAWKKFQKYSPKCPNGGLMVIYPGRK